MAGVALATIAQATPSRKSRRVIPSPIVLPADPARLSVIGPAGAAIRIRPSKITHSDQTMLLCQ
jgi:hypothetical protein